MYITNRLTKAFLNTEKFVEINGLEVIYPIDLFYGLFLDKSGVIDELIRTIDFDNDRLIKASFEILRVDGGVTADYSKLCISESLIRIIEEAEKYMRRYGQIYLNAGHVIKAMINNDEIIQKIFSLDEIEVILEITTQSRDLYVNIQNNTFMRSDLVCNYNVVRANLQNQKEVIKFVENEFNLEWAQNVEKGFRKNIISVFIAVENKEIVGFGVYDVIGEGIFGPMGVSKKYRSENIGAKLLHALLNDMNHLGYENVIINDAGPIEFYEKTCNASIYKW